MAQNTRPTHITSSTTNKNRHMRKKRNLLITIYFTYALTLIGQKTTVTFDFSNLNYGKIPKKSVFIKSYYSESVPEQNTFSVEVEHFPTMLAIGVYEKRGYRYLKLIWVDDLNIKVEGTLDDISSLEVTNESKEQKTANEIFDAFKDNIELDNELVYTKPYIIYLCRSREFRTLEHLNKVVNELPVELNDFWAVEELKKYLSDIDAIKHSSENKKYKKLTAINKNGNQQTYNLTGDKFLLLEFSFSGCRYCLKGIDKMVKLYPMLSDQLDIVMIWNDKDFDIWINSFKEHKNKITWLSYWDKNGSICRAYDIIIYPTYILFDRQGNFIKEWNGGFPNNIEKYIN